MAEMNARAAAQGYSVPQQQQQVQYPPQQQQQQYAPPNVQQHQQVVQQPVTLSVPLRGGGYAPNANANLIELKEAVLERGQEARREEEEEEEELDDVDEYASDEDEVEGDSDAVNFLRPPRNIGCQLHARAGNEEGGTHDARRRIVQVRLQSVCDERED